MHPISHVRSLSLSAVLLLAACTDAVTDARPEPPEPGPAGRPVTIQEVLCRGSIADGRVECAPAPVTDGSALIVGGQGVYVQLTSSNVAYDGGTGQFTFDVTIQNLIEQPMGTADGAALDPNGVRIFFVEGPSVTGGSGSASVNPDGFGTFTAAGQPYYQYSEVLEEGETSGSRGWTLIVSPTVTTFTFKVLVAAAVPFPDGYVSLNGELPGFYAGELHPDSTLALTAVSKTVVGNVIPGQTHTFTNDDPLCASVSPGGVVTGLRAANCDLEVSDGTRTGYVNLTVTGTTRVWAGSESTDWAVGGNWTGGFVPAVEDSVLVPSGTPNQPGLTAPVTLQGLTVQDNATLSLGAFTLTANADVAGAPTIGGIVSTSGVLELAGTGSLSGGISATRVTGSYTLAGEVRATAPVRVASGSLRNAGYLLRASAQ